MLLFAWFFACSSALPVVKMDLSPAPLDVPTSPDAVARGDRLVHGALICDDCHGEDLAGDAWIDAFPMGTIVAPDLTDLDYAPADWVRAIRHGVGKDGHALLIMPSHLYAALTAEDLGATVAYLETLTPVEKALPKPGLGPVGKALVKKGEWSYAADRIDHAAPVPTTVEDPGLYLATIGRCMDCHAGGPGKRMGPGRPPAANITPSDDGIGPWTEADFAVAMRTGRRPDGRVLDDVMPWRSYENLTDQELSDLYTWLRTLPPMPDGY